MNKGIAHILMSRLAGIVFIDLFAGIVTVQEKEDIVVDEAHPKGRSVMTRFPVSCDVIDRGSCPAKPGNLVTLIPDSKRKGILYFEDNGVTPLGRRRGAHQYKSNLRLVCWLNTMHLDLNSCYELTMPVMTTVIAKLTTNPFNRTGYQGITVVVDRIPKSGKDIFSAYTYNNAQRQYLMPPYEAWALDLTVTYSINPNCIDAIPTIDPQC